MTSRLFWQSRHPVLMARARKEFLAHQPCTICNGLQMVKFKDNYETCPCLNVAEDARQFGALSTVTPNERLKTFDQLERWGTNAEWASFEATMGSLKRLTKSPLDHQWITVSGVCGNGKTSLVLSAYNLMPDLSVYISAPELADGLFTSLARDEKLRFGKKQLTLGELKDVLVSVPVLFLDDLGLEHSGDFVTNTFSDIIARRYAYASERPTVVTTNLSKAELAARYPYGRLADRITDEHLVLRHPIMLPSYRQRGANKIANGSQR